MTFVDFMKEKLDAAGDLMSEKARHVSDSLEQGFDDIEEHVKEFLTQAKTNAIEHPEPIFAALRRLRPIAKIKGTYILTRFEDVQEVLARDWVFHQTYGHRMEEVTGGRNFFLGMQNTPSYTRQETNMRLAAQRDDIENWIIPLATEEAEALLDASGGALDVVKDFARPAIFRVMSRYIHSEVPDDVEEHIDWWLSFTNYIFFFHGEDKTLPDTALANAEKMRNYFDGKIAERKASDGNTDDCLGRLLKIQEAGIPDNDDIGVRNTMIGLFMGSIASVHKSTTSIVDQLLDRPDVLAGAIKAAHDDDDELLRKYCMEALRFDPFAPGQLRLCAQDYVVARSHARRRKIPKGAAVFVATQSAMLDGRELEEPKEFRLDRPDYQYMHYGYGLHTCFGQYIATAHMVQVVKALLKRKKLRRAEGEASQLKLELPYPVSMTVEFDG